MGTNQLRPYQHQCDGNEHHYREDGTEGQGERQLFPLVTGLGDLIGYVEGLGEGAGDSRDRPQRDGHSEDQQIASRPLLGPIYHPYKRLDLLPGRFDHGFELLWDLLVWLCAVLVDRRVQVVCEARAPTSTTRISRNGKSPKTPR